MANKHLNILTHVMTKTYFYFGGIGQFTDTIPTFWSMY